MQLGFSFEGRTEQLIASGRVVLASFSLLAIWLDPSAPAKYADLVYALLAVYVVYALAVDNKGIRGLAGLLQDKSSIPMIQAELTLILDLLTDEWWQNVTVPNLENVRRRIRSLIGLDREAAKKALGSFLGGKPLRANQIELLNLIVDHLTEHGSMDARLLYDSPYTDFSPRGVDGVFESKEVDELLSALEEVRKRAVG
jgi:type I site-specific restriction endonuclease